MVELPAAEQLAGVDVIVGTAGVANCAPLLKDDEAARSTTSIARSYGISCTYGHVRNCTARTYGWSSWTKRISIG